MKNRLQRVIVQREYLVLFSIMVLALVLRLVGLSYGLPNLYVVDEAQVVFDGARFHPQIFFKPLVFSVYGPLMSYLINFFFIVYGLILFIVGDISNSTDLYFLFETNKTPFFLIARTVSLFLQMITIFFVFWLAVKFFKTKTSGLFAALFLSLSVTYLKFARIAEPESLMALICSLSIFFAFRIAKKGKIIDYILLGLSIGLAISTKYNAYLFVLLMPLAHLLYSRRYGGWLKKFIFEKKFYLCFIFLVLGIFLGHPPIWIKIDELISLLFTNPRRLITFIYPSYSYATSALRTGWLGKSIQTNPFWIFKAILINEGMFGYLIFAGIIFSFARHKLVDIILLSLTVAYLFMISTYTRIGNDIHYLFPIFPIFSLLVGRLIAESLFLAKSKILQAMVLTLLFYFTIFPVAKLDIMKAKNLIKKDRRTVAREWVEKNIAWGTKIATVPYSPELFDPEMSFSCSSFCNQEKLRPKLWEYAKSNPWYKIVLFRYREVEPVWPERWSKDMHDLYFQDDYVRGQYAFVYRSCDFLEKEKVEYLILSSGFYARYLKENMFDESNPLYELFERNKKVLLEIIRGDNPCFSEIKIIASDGDLVGPEIRIYKVTPSWLRQNQR